MEFFADDSAELRDIRSEIVKYRATHAMNDRERARFLGLPEGCRMRENAKIFAPEKLRIGKHVWIGEGAMLDAMGGLEIGDYCQIATYVMVWSHTSHHQALRGETNQSRASIIYRPTKIGRNCFIAGHSVVSAGVTIGDGVIVAPMSFVDRDLPDGASYGTNKIIRSLEKTVEALRVELEDLKSRLRTP